MTREYYVSYGRIGFAVDRFEKAGNLVYLWNGNSLVTFINLNWTRLRLSQVIDNTIYFRLEDI